MCVSNTYERRCLCDYLGMDIRMLNVSQNIIKTLHGASFAQGNNFLAQASRKAMHTCIRTYTYMYTYVYTYAFEVKNRIPCMSLLTTRLPCAAQFWLRPVLAKYCIFFCARIAQAPRKLCARQSVFDSKGTSASNHSCIK